jgi:hypothetical protein
MVNATTGDELEEICDMVGVSLLLIYVQVELMQVHGPLLLEVIL